MLRPFKRLIEALGSLTVALRAAVELLPALQDHLELRERLDALERSRAAWEGEMEGQFARVEGKWSATRAAEARARHMLSQLSEPTEDDDPGLENDAIRAYLEAVQRGNAPAGGGEELHPVRNGLETRADAREALRRAKFGQ